MSVTADKAVETQEPVWLSQLETLVNKALQLDEETLYLLSQLESKVIAFEFINTRLTLFIFPSEKGLSIKTEYPDKPDVWIKSSPGNFIKLISSSKNGSGLPADMQIIGDISLAQRFQSIMQGIEIDLEEPLSKWVGDPVAYQIGRLFRGSRQFLFNTSKILATDVSEYLRFEIEMLPDDLLLEEFCNDVDRLREDVDRLTQRIDKLQASINSKAQGS